MSLGNCKTCKAMVIWAKSPKGANLPLDGHQLRGADDPRLTPRLVVYRIENTYDAQNAIPVERQNIPLAKEPLYLSHFATCPDAASHSKGRRVEPSRQEAMFS